MRAPEGSAEPIDAACPRLGTLLGATLDTGRFEGGAPRHSDSWLANEGRILLADDNADMRNYVLRLLEPYFEVRAACRTARPRWPRRAATRPIWC